MEAPPRGFALIVKVVFGSVLVYIWFHEKDVVRKKKRASI